MDNKIINNTLLGVGRLETLKTLLSNVEHIHAGVVEIGVYKGGSARMLCSSTKDTVYLIDTYEGLPDANQYDNYHKKGDFNDTSISHVVSVLGELTNYKIIQQIFPYGDTSELDDMKFKLVHIDVDLYQSVKDCLEYFYPRMVNGGVIILDDYGAPSCLGAKKATDEFLKDKPETLKPGQECAVYIVIGE